MPPDPLGAAYQADCVGPTTLSQPGYTPVQYNSKIKAKTKVEIKLLQKSPETKKETKPVQHKL